GIYVAGDVGSDTGPGTGAAPVATIAKGIELAQKLGAPTSVYVAGRANNGKYAEKVALVEGVSLYGGYDCKALPCSWARDVQANTTVISNTDYRGVVAGDTITRATVLDGLAISGKGGVPDAAPGAVGLMI